MSALAASSTWSSSLDLSDGVLIFTVTETPDRVCFTITGAIPRLDEAPILFRFMDANMAAMAMRYEQDPRPIYVSDRDSTARLFLPSGYLFRYRHAERS
jgi:hypothetical protein